mmetsp:Transcript_29803/g.65161  ORF Transcript_29803/g.65161 Transcript_29803/m.65161 type:complete len:205 (+) Transcript_29803:1280-1894(+)
MNEPNLRISSNMSFLPPEKPRQFASSSSGSPSPVLKSRIACAVLYAESGNHTCPACMAVCGFDSRFAGSARIDFSTVRFSVMMTPTGMPPSRPRPTTTVLAQCGRYSTKEFASSRPSLNAPLCSPPVSSIRGSYGLPGSGVKHTGRSTGSHTGRIGRGAPVTTLGTKPSHSTIRTTPPKSSSTTKCDTPLPAITSGPPSCRFDS